MKIALPAVALLAAVTVLTGCSKPKAPAAPPTRLSFQPEFPSSYAPKPGWAMRHHAVATAHPLATEAGQQILQAGGSAVDAAIAVQMVLTLVEPQSSGIGGGAFMLHSSNGKVDAYDGRETAPAAVDTQLFIGKDGKPLAFDDAAVGGRAVGVPGVLRMLELAHQQHGKLPWSRLFAPAITLAEKGFAISPRLAEAIASDPHLKKDPAAAAYFHDFAGVPLAAGRTLTNPELARLLRRVAAEGANAFYQGEVARAIVAKVKGHAGNPGTITRDDIAAYRARQRTPLCTDYRAAERSYRICGFPPPSSGGIAVAQILGMLASTPAAAMPLQNGLPAADWLHYYTEAGRLAFADRAQYVADPDFSRAPGSGWASLVAPQYLARRAQEIGPRSLHQAKPGDPPRLQVARAPMPMQHEGGTSHLSIVDGHGNAVAMTSSIEDRFGARQMVQGFLLNNQLTDFSFTPADADGRPVANRVQPGKRPRSSMAPTLVFEKHPEGGPDRLVMSAGSPGGAFIIHFTAKTLYATLNWGLGVQDAINLPNFGTLNGPTVLEEGRFPPATIGLLRGRVHEVRQRELASGIQALHRPRNLWFGGADPRREGTVAGR